MRAKTKIALEKDGWAVGDAAGFLGLTDEEACLIELKVSLAEGVRRLREKRGAGRGRSLDQRCGYVGRRRRRH